MGDKNKKQKMSSENYNAQQQEPPLDRLSNLPDAILVDILSLVPTKTAVSTSVLSNRWRYLWTYLTSLHLDFRHFPKHSTHFYTIVDHLLTRLTSPFLHIFSLHVPFFRHQYFESWLRHLSARNVQIIDVNVDYFHSDNGATVPGTPFTMPRCIFQTKSLVCLNFPAYRFQYHLPHDTNGIPQLPNLKTLRLKLSSSQCGFVAILVRSCPLLESLSLVAAERWHKQGENDDDDDDDDDDDADDDASIEILSGSLKRLHLNMLAVAKNFKIVIDAPKLDCFSLFASNLNSCSFVRKPIALNQATIITASKPLVWSLIPVISTVRLLRILAVTIGLFEDCKDDLGNTLIFRNLIELNLQLGTESDKLRFGSGADGLDSFPFELPSPSLLSRVKKIQVVKHNVTHGKIMKLTKYLLSNAPALELLSFIDVPRPRGILDKITYMIIQMVFCMALNLRSREFPQCQIQFRGQYAILPEDSSELQRMKNRVQALISFLTLVDDTASDF